MDSSLNYVLDLDRRWMQTYVRYDRCPGCEKMFCDLNCSKKHKEEWNCSGKRDKTKFIPIKYYSEQNMWDGTHLVFIKPCLILTCI
jgi:hypothetical protein